MQLRGVRPFLSSKYDLTKHPNYYLTGDLFDIEKFLNRQMKLKPDEKYEVVNGKVVPKGDEIERLHKIEAERRKKRK